MFSERLMRFFWCLAQTRNKERREQMGTHGKLVIASQPFFFLSQSHEEAGKAQGVKWEENISSKSSKSQIFFSHYFLIFLAINSSSFLPLPFFPSFSLTVPFTCQERSISIQMLMSSLFEVVRFDLIGIWQLWYYFCYLSLTVFWELRELWVFHFEQPPSEVLEMS